MSCSSQADGVELAVSLWWWSFFRNKFLDFSPQAFIIPDIILFFSVAPEHAPSSENKSSEFQSSVGRNMLEIMLSWVYKVFPSLSLWQIQDLKKKKPKARNNIHFSLSLADSGPEERKQTLERRPFICQRDSYHSSDPGQ